jgi:lipopolysaccharide transport system ATP-binding protein
MGAISQLCTKGILLKDGEMQLLGNMDDVIVEYLSMIKSSSEFVQEAEKNKPAYFKRIYVTDKEEKVRAEFKIDEPVCIEFEIEIKTPGFKCDIFVLVLDSKKRKIFAAETPLVKKKNKLIIEPNFLVRGDYSIHTFINVPMIEQVDVVTECCPFSIIDNGSLMAKHSIYDYGSVLGRYVWE